MPFRQTLTKVRVVTRNKILEYDSLRDAQEAFPDQLDLYRGSKVFTCAMDSGDDRLLFETWDIANALDED
jgi:hypothetical protein